MSNEETFIATTPKMNAETVPGWEVPIEKRPIGALLYTVAKYKGMSQAEIGAAVGISRLSINRFFMGHTQLRADDFMAVCKALGVDIREIIVSTFVYDIKRSQLPK